MGQDIHVAVDVLSPPTGHHNAWRQVWTGTLGRNYRVFTLLGVSSRDGIAICEPRPAMQGPGMSPETALLVWPLDLRGERVILGMSSFPGPATDDEYAGWLNGYEVRAVWQVISGEMSNLDALVDLFADAPGDHVRVHFWSYS